MERMYTGLQKRQLFESLDAFKSFVRGASIRQRWDLSVIRSNRQSVALGCRSSPDCTFRVICRTNKNYTYVTSVTDTHTCRTTFDSPVISIQRSQPSRLTFLMNEIPKFFDTNTKVSAQNVVVAIKRYYGTEVSHRQAHKALTKLEMLKGKRRGRPSNPSEGQPTINEMSNQIASNSHHNSQQQQQQQQHADEHDQAMLPMDTDSDYDCDDDDFEPPESSRPVPQSSFPQPPPDALSRSHHVPTALNSSSTNENQGSANNNNDSQNTPHSHPNLDMHTRGQQRRARRPPMLPTDLKIEFSCAACGAIN
ncbi:hypothetical protein AJ78_05406 [Emergomyces pasteurianus Ep9510]|uniref:Transposase MuDR plant domain-containing protein n=1 Tax=Emergomyces pasteurianus Ep9510 TaxID=1447872 RepID=A0A1J9QE57_9EURO|nr:hypothetical protein AJ78_05406 [Emergomyces pasteurianus Ep9510]